MDCRSFGLKNCYKMKRIRVEKNKNYTTISNVFLRDERLSLKAKGFLAMIMSLKDDWNFTIEGFVKITKEGESAIYTAIKELKDFGYCREEKIRDEKKRIVGNEYTFYEEPKTQSVDNQLDCENQDLGFLNQANQGQISTTNNSTNNKILKNKEKSDVDLSFVADDFLPIVQDWLAYKKEKKQTYKQRGAKMFYSQLVNLSNNDAEIARLIIEQSMANNWAGIFALRNNHNANQFKSINQCQKDDSVTIGGQTYK